MDTLRSSRPSTTQAAAAFAQSVSLKISTSAGQTKTQRVIENFRASAPPQAQGQTAVARLSASTALALLQLQTRV
jgi:hypothetical protein